MKSQIRPKVNIAKAVGKGYGAFWRSKARYRVVKGSRASKKSKTAALWYIYNLMKYPESNLLVVRKTFSTLKDSFYTELQWAVKRLKVEEHWHFRLQPLEAVYKPTGQKIYFRGMDDPLKTTSITVSVGVLCWLLVEEAYEIMSEPDFDTLDESIRGEMPPGLWKQTTLILNPWNERHWIKSRFFDVKSPDVFAATTNYKVNEFLDDADRKMFAEMKKRNPRRYQVAGLGHWGIVEGLVYENWTEQSYTLNDLPEDAVSAAGLDYGYTHDPTAFVMSFYSPSERKLYVWDEFYKKGLSNKKIAEEITRLGYSKESITADSAEPKSNAELRSLGLRVNGAKKGPDSIMNGIQWIQDLEIVIHPRCVNFITEISNYGFKPDKFGKLTNQPVDDFNHCITGDTLVDTTQGQIPISELVGREGEVFCYNLDTMEKSVEKYYEVRKTRSNADVFELELENGKVVKATADHLILTLRGWIELRALQENDEVIDINLK